MRLNELIRTLTAFVLFTMCAACSTSGRISQDVYLAVNYPEIQRYYILPSHPLNLLNEENLTPGLAPPAIQAIADQAFVKTPLQAVDNKAEAQVLIAITLGNREHIHLYDNYFRLSESNWLWGSDPRLPRYSDSSLAIDVFDANTGNAIWHAYTDLNDWPPKKEPPAAKLQDALFALLKTFPPDIQKLYRSVPKQGIIYVR